MKQPKKMVSLRMSDQTIKMLEYLQQRYNRSKADVIALLIYADYNSLEVGSEEFQNIVNSPL